MAKRPTTISGPDAAWRARDDMRTLAEAENIRGDTKRHAAAVEAAKAERDKLARVARRRPGGS